MSDTITAQDQYVVARVLEMLGSGKALAQDLEDYIVGYGVLGRLAAMAQGEAEYAEQDRKMAWSNAYLAIKNGPIKVTDKTAEVQADIEVDKLRRIEIEKKERSMRLRATQDTVREAVWGIKALAKQGG